MLKVVLIDDEYYTRKALRVTTPWEELGYQLCGEADNGKEGLDLILDKEPDVALIDINMPIMDGLTLIRELRVSKSLTHCVMLTGYSEFDYVRQALQLGVSNYILKPVPQEELRDELIKLRNKILPGKRKKREEILAQLSGDTHYLVEFTGNSEINKQIQAKSFKRLITFQMLMNNQRPDADTIEMNINILKDVIYTIIDEIELEGVCWVASYEECSLFISSEDIKEVSNESIMEKLIELSNLINNKYMSRMIVCLSSIFKDVQCLRDISKKNQHILANRLVLDTHKPICCKDVVINNPYQHKGISDKERHLLTLCLRKKDEEYLKNIIKNIFQEIKDNLYSISVIESVVQQLFSLAYEYAMECQSTKVMKWQNRKQLREQIATFFTLDELIEWMNSFFKDLMEAIIVREVSESDLLVNEIKSYILEHYHEQDCNINKVVSHFNFNYHYICKLFKTKTGDSLGEYIITTRMIKAKEIIEKGQHNVEILSANCGYGDSRYFSKCFKKYHGITPSSYIKRNR
ncbi:response regulator transcription factor [Vallitalea okinawensis]|uniref:response regulator transcription factor n=1 Tax=Vallitalea okinawensis TaxID=2078660 RepID=UPI000CFCC486|nr:response regulator [Vallitalea okinawensis]